MVHCTGLGEAGCGPGVEREVIENFTKGLVTSCGTVLEQSSDACISNEKIGESISNGKQSYRMFSNGKKRSREGEDASTDEFALFQAFQSSENDKCLYIPVPVRYQAHRGLNFVSSHSECAMMSARRGEKYVVSSVVEKARKNLRSCPLLKRGFRAFGKVVGHFILRKIASAGKQSESVSVSIGDR